MLSWVHQSISTHVRQVLVQAVEALSTSCQQDLQGLNTRIHCPQNGQSIDLSEGADSLRMVRARLSPTCADASPCACFERSFSASTVLHRPCHCPDAWSVLTPCDVAILQEVDSSMLA